MIGRWVGPMSCALFTMTVCAPVNVDDAVFWILQVLGRVTDLFTADSGPEVEVEQVSCRRPLLFAPRRGLLTRFVVCVCADRRGHSRGRGADVAVGGREAGAAAGAGRMLVAYGRSPSAAVSSEPFSSIVSLPPSVCAFPVNTAKRNALDGTANLPQSFPLLRTFRPADARSRFLRAQRIRAFWGRTMEEGRTPTDSPVGGAATKLIPRIEKVGAPPSFEPHADLDPSLLACSFAM